MDYRQKDYGRTWVITKDPRNKHWGPKLCPVTNQKTLKQINNATSCMGFRPIHLIYPNFWGEKQNEISKAGLNVFLSFLASRIDKTIKEGVRP